MIKLVLTDLDGTFLNKNGSFDQTYYEKIKTIMDQNNIAFAPCTGKQCERVEELFDTDISDNIWILGDSATRIKHKGKYIYESLLPNKLGIQIVEKLEEIASDHIIIACTPTAAYIKSTVSEEDTQKVKKSYALVKTQANLQDIEEDFVKITVYDQKLRAFENVKQLSNFESQAYIVASEAAWIDISNYNVHKGTTVQELQKILGVTKEETIAFGDGLNDIELLEAAGCSFAVNNAFDIVKEKADFITKSNEESGVLQTIEKLMILQK
ncbi:hydrolase haloacid dehalogenase-like family [Lactococcus cremoris]|uniref:Hydrolase haloacid dehalogenase-like family n=1 Tax=Lactococcus lactis subsp. cremoris TaxID=1359 RepID=A0A166KN34_LACLC|nr:HAD family hydrolase [Lactococcus cremoris]KZK08655.1 hydrolase haloacid dehalogenase-like family [Lactococcus cremoris]